MSQLIAILEDEQDIIDLITINLRRAGLSVEAFQDYEQFMRFLRKQIPDLIILDLMLPGADGFEICKYLRRKDEFSAIPIIMVTARSEETDKILGLELGADDYVTKPFSPRELVARVKAVLRRKTPGELQKVISVGSMITLNSDKHEVVIDGEVVELTSTEFKILFLLASRKGWVFTRERILDYLWGDEKAVLDRTVDVHIKNLREKLGKGKDLVKNVRGVGYKVDE
ncbi:MAG TPA: response regulator [Thermodesulfobacteriota bacterium]|nr:response regulator [Deltaproteobacteria bacterium]HNR14852.1 response regulator [Thermodesulfobacteriota bacterium]HNU70476.1 response regulator [Thermodesulfobacteriota bacterium]HOC38960.1 response regulator [Thermodesulfobacteriota bacterium]